MQACYRETYLGEVNITNSTTGSNETVMQLQENLKCVPQQMCASACMGFASLSLTGFASDASTLSVSPFLLHLSFVFALPLHPD